MRKNGRKRRAVKEDAAVAADNTVGTSPPVVVVGIGASAGGLKSLEQLFAKMPTGRGVAFVFVTHLEAKRKSQTVKLLANHTSLAVAEAKDDMPLLADRIHVIPPDKYLNITDNILTLREPILCNSLRMPIDHFFCSLALDQRGRGVGILLSGKSSDGILGLSEIKAVGGRTFVEEPGDAEYPGMLQSAIDVGVADAVLPVSAMAEAVTALADKVTTGTRSSHTYPPEFDADVRAILDILRAKVGHDFLCYKPNTIIRRIRRRMGLAMISTFADYAGFLHEHTKEVSLLQKDLLIGVTDFFRQPQAWEILEEKIITPLVDNAHPGSEIRIWVPGCSTGQEAYSLAMLLTEHAEKSGKKLTAQIFATDSDFTSLATARSGIYSKEDIGENVSSGRLKRFFARKDGHYEVVKDIREQVVFAPQNITADPPFSRLDLISCRNLLIYLDQQVQKKIITLFHFSLREGGFIFLGTSETVGDRSDLFEPVSKKWRIYRRIGVGHRVNVEIPLRPTGALLPAGSGDSGRATAKPPLVAPPSRMSLASGAQHMLLDRFAPACVMIDRKLQVLYVHGSVENYLTFPPGELTTRVVDMAREGLRARLRGAITKCLETNKSVSINARVRRSKKSVPVKVIVSPLRYPREIDGLLLITFEDYFLPAPKSRRQAVSDSSVRQMEDELKVTREELHSTIEQLENSNDQLKASNEEVMAANEELQSANEELETSKEELQSLNEELNTIKIRLEEKVDELEGVNNDVVNLLSSTNIATVFLDKELRVKRYTPAITRLLSLISTDTGRPFADVLRRFTDETLLDDARRVLADLMPQDSEVQGDDGRWYIRRITPYRTHDDRIEGVVITFVDVADLKEAQEALRQLNAELEQRVSERTAELWAASLYARSLIEAGLDPLVTISPEGRITDVNEATEQITGQTRRELIGTDFSEYFTDPSSAQTGYRNVLADGQVRDYPLTIRHKSGNTTEVLYNATVYRNQAGEVQGVFAAARDVTELKRAEAALKEANETLEQRVMERTAELAQSEERLRLLVEGVQDYVIFMMDENGYVASWNTGAERMKGWTALEIIGQHFSRFYPPELVEQGDPHRELEIAANTGQYHDEGQRMRKDGSFFWADVTITVLRDSDDRLRGFAKLTRDITKRKKAEQALHEARDRAEWLARFPDENPNPVMRVSADGIALYCNRTSVEIPGWACEAGAQLSDPFLPLVERAMIERQEIQQDVELGGRYYLVAVVPIPGEGYANVYGRDITERKLTEDALRESEERLKRAQEIAHLGSWELDLIQNRLTWSDEVYRIFGLQPQEFGATYETFLERVHPDDRASVDNAYSGSLRDNRNTYEIEHRVVRKDTGEIRIAHERCEHIRDATGKIIRSVGMVHDITERVRAEKAVLQAKQEWERTFDAVPDLIAILDDHHHILRANKAMAERLGVAPQQCVGETCHKAVHGLDYPPDFCPHTLALADGQEHVEEVHEDCLGGDFLVSATPLTDELGRLIGSVHVARDITKRKQAEQILLERTAELEALNRELESFSYSVSHDLRAPLRAIDGYARSILKKQEDKFDEDTKRRFNDIRLNAKMMGQIIDDLLAFSRLGKKHISISKLDMDAVITDVWKELQTANPERNMKLILNSMPCGCGDRTLIKQVYFNLLSNAVKFTKFRDAAHIEAGGYTEGNEDVYYLKDNGVGFDMAYYDKLFGVFQRLHNPDDFEGTGVGLATIQRIVHRHEGRVWAEGKVDEVATFYFSLPRKG